MCFKALLGLALAVVLAGCGLRAGETPAPPLSPSFKGENYSCVGHVPEKLDAYVRDQMSPNDIKSFVLCLQKAFVTFSALTRGRAEGVYSPEELRLFLEKNFLRGRYVITDVLLNEFMLLKVTLVGGVVDKVTRGEIYAIVDVLHEIQEELIRLKPHLGLLNPSLNQAGEPETLAERLKLASEAVGQTIRVFAGRLEKAKDPYALEHLRVFMSEFRRFVRWDSHFKNPLPVEAWVDLLRAFKIAAVTPLAPDYIRPDQWGPLLHAMWNWYKIYVHYQFGVKGQVIIEDVGLQNLVLLGDEVFDLTRDAIRRQPDLTLSFDVIMDVVTAAIDLRWIPPRVRTASIRRAMTALTTRVFGDPRTPPSDRRANGLTMDALASMSADFYRWAKVQIDLNQVYARTRPNVKTPPLASRNYLNPEIRQQLAGQRGSEWLDFMNVSKLIEPLFPESEDGGLVRVVLAPPPVRQAMGIEHGFTNLSYMNILRTLVSLVFRGYAEAGQGRSAWATGIQSDELELFYQEFRDFGVDLQLVDWRNCNAGARSFAEGNLFTYTSDGVPFRGDGGRLDVREAMQLFAYLYSGGVLAFDYYRQLSEGPLACPHGPKDINNLDKLSRACVRERLPELISHLDNLPGLRDYVITASPETRLHYADTLLDAVFTKKNLHEDPAKQWVEMNELSSLVVVMHYAESVMVRFDRPPYDGRLDLDELNQAVPIFSGFIRKFMREQLKVSNLINWDFVARGAFLFIAREGRLPTDRFSWDLIKDDVGIGLMGTRKLWTLGELLPLYGTNGGIELDRLKLARAFGAIINKLLDGGPDVDVRTRQCMPKAAR